MYRNRLLLSLLFSLISVVAQSATPIARILAHPALQTASVGVVVLDIESGETVVSYQGEYTFTPASLLKVVTTSTALQLYGRDFQYPTQLEAHGDVDSNGTLHGSLVVVGSGSPTLGSKWGDADDANFLSSCVAAIKQAGITKIEGKVVADASRLGSEGVSPKWIWEDIGNYYAAGVYALNYGDNLYNLTLRSGAVGTTPTVVGTTPALNLTFENHLVAATNSKDSAYIYGAPFSSQRQLYGSIPAQRKNFTIKGDMPHPPLYLAKALVEALSKSGIEVTNGATATFMQSNTIDANLIHIHRSMPLSKIVTITNQHSNNLYAEALLRLVAQNNHPNTTATATQGIAELRNYWQQQGIDCRSLTMYDGSGLSPLNALSPLLIAEILRWMKVNSPHRTVFEESLPTVAESGTVRSLLRDTPLAGKLHLKSGSMQGVLCYAGYSDNGRVVVIMVNNYTASRQAVQKQLEQLLLSLPL